MSMAIVGHLGCGKSTLIGHLLVQLGVIDFKRAAATEKQATEAGHKDLKFSWVGSPHAGVHASSHTRLSAQVPLSQTPT